MQPHTRAKITEALRLTELAEKAIASGQKIEAMGYLVQAEKILGFAAVEMESEEVRV